MFQGIYEVVVENSLNVIADWFFTAVDGSVTAVVETEEHLTKESERKNNKDPKKYKYDIWLQYTRYTKTMYGRYI